MKKAIGIFTGIIGAVSVIFGMLIKIRKNYTLAAIGGTDGPTAVFIAGKYDEESPFAPVIKDIILGKKLSPWLILSGIILMATSGVLLFKKK